MDGGMFEVEYGRVISVISTLLHPDFLEIANATKVDLNVAAHWVAKLSSSYIYIIIYLWKRHWWYYKLLTLSTFGSHHVPQHVFSPCQPTWATSRQSSNGLLTQIWTKIGWPQIWFDGLSSFCTFNWQFWIIWGYSQFLRKVWIDTCVFFVTCLGIYSCFTPSLAKHG